MYSYITTEVLSKPTKLETERATQRDTVPTRTAKSQVSPWLERTRWLHYLDGADWREIALLEDSPDLQSEPVLDVPTTAIDRLAETAYESVCADRVNYFGQKRIASFLPCTTGCCDPFPNADEGRVDVVSRLALEPVRDNL